MTRRCHICNEDVAPVERATVRCNVRAFKGERFAVWRCPRCASIHGDDAVDLEAYYRKYPFHAQRYDAMARIIYDRLLRRLKRAGLRKHHSVLDYGCGSGLFVEHLRRRGYAHAAGYDAYSPAFRDPAPLARRWDFVVAQDVVEHDAAPRALLGRLDALAAPDGVVAVGTPNAAAVDLARADSYLHTLHQPYHTHIFAKDALLEAGRALGWTLSRWYRTMYSNTLVPGLNQRFALRYAAAFDDTIDLAFDGPRFSWRLLSPVALFLAFFGYFFSAELDVMAVFRKGRAPQSVSTQ